MYFALYSEERGGRVWIFIAGTESVNLVSWSVCRCGKTYGKTRFSQEHTVNKNTPNIPNKTKATHYKNIINYEQASYPNKSHITA